jgi:hypothetical protein
MYHLKPLSRDAVESALAKAERYRLLNEPLEAESICRDVLEVDPDNQAARVMLLLALTDQFADEPRASGLARDVLQSMPGEYERQYYAGLIAERRGKAQFRRGTSGVYEWIREAMHHYEAADSLRPAGHDDARLRWNACARFLQRHSQLGPADDRREVEMLE